MKKIRFTFPLVAAFVMAFFLPSAVNAAQINFTVATAPNLGTITGPGINCGSDCSESLEEGSTVTLTATPMPGLLLDHGPGCPSGTPGVVTCSVTVTSGTTPVYIFSYASYSITATKEGTGTGTVSGVGTYGHKSTVTLTATPSPGSTFAGWQPSGSACATPGGKGDSTVNPSPTCSFMAKSSVSSSFNAVAKFDKTTTSSPSSPSGSSGTGTAPAPTPSTAAPTKPAAPGLDDVAVEGVTQNTSEKISVSNNKPLLLSGKTIPNGKVALFIFSEPKRYDITADAEGKWSYSVSGLPEGNHHAEIEVTDPATNLTSDRVKLLDFTILASTTNPEPNNTIQNQKKSSNILPLIIAGVVIALAGAGAVGFFWWKRKQKAAQTFNPFNHQNPSNT